MLYEVTYYLSEGTALHCGMFTSEIVLLFRNGIISIELLREMPFYTNYVNGYYFKICNTDVCPIWGQRSALPDIKLF